MVAGHLILLLFNAKYYICRRSELLAADDLHLFYVFQIIWDRTEKSIISRRRGLKNLMNRQTARDWMNWGDLQTKGANVKVGIITVSHRGWCKTRVDVIEEMDVGGLEDENHKIRKMTKELIHRIILKALLNGNFFHVVFSGRLCCIFMRRWRWMYIGGTPKEKRLKRVKLETPFESRGEMDIWLI